MNGAIFDALEDNLSMMADLVSDRFPAWKGVLDEGGELDTLEVIRLYLEQEDDADLAGPGDLSPEISAEPGAAFSYGFLLGLGSAHDMTLLTLIGELQAETKRRTTR